MHFLIIPVSAWIVCGLIKFGVNSVKYPAEAVDRIGHGGFPSNHTAIVSSVMWALMIGGEWNTAGLALAVLMTSVFDAMGLRREVGRHATILKQLSGTQMREVMGHSLVDVGGGLAVGLTVAIVFHLIYV